MSVGKWPVSSNGCFKPPKNQTAAAFGLKTSQDTTFQLSSALWAYQPKFMRTSLAFVPEEINATWERALLNPVAPLKVTDGPCQETVLLKDQVRLDRLPIPTWTPEKDIGPYITTPVVTSNAHTRRQNVGFYRTRVRDAN